MVGRNAENEYEIHTQLLGPRAAPEGKVLNRLVRWSARGWEAEADPRHAELNQEQLAIKSGGGITTAGAGQEENATEEESEELTGKVITLFRGLAARCNDLSLDRPDIQYAAKEVCMEMSRPTAQSFQKLKRIGQYLFSKPRLVWEFSYQEKVACLDACVDANWAACRRSRKSTSGGCAMIGTHCLKICSKTQATIAKPSVESELYGVIRGSTEGLGLATMCQDMGL